MNSGHNASKIRRPRHNAPKLQDITLPIIRRKKANFNL